MIRETRERFDEKGIGRGVKKSLEAETPEKSEEEKFKQDVMEAKGLITSPGIAEKLLENKEKESAKWKLVFESDWQVAKDTGKLGSSHDVEEFLTNIKRMVMRAEYNSKVMREAVTQYYKESKSEKTIEK